MKAPIYLRDLNDTWKKEYISIWKARKRTDLLGAVELDEDIIVGYYVKDGDEKMVDE